MVELVGGEDKRFYDALKNSQPLAFLASVSIGIAVLIHQIEEFSSVYNYAIIAGSMFLFSFIASLVYQLIPLSDETKQKVRWSQYVFLGLGIMYLLLIVLNFSQKITSIMTLVFGWGFLAMGISYIIPLKKQWSTLKKEKSKVVEVIFTIIVLFGLSLLFFVISFSSTPLVKT
ncbi:MAG: hypothetical protein KGI28_00375 [Thaumarchaeota archaeon]|nr:hypothetical protein [Nitrososphaerota archaeon]